MASIKLQFEEDNSWTSLTVRTQDDLPEHVKRRGETGGAYWDTFPQNQPPSYKCLVRGTPRAVEFINDDWYLLNYSRIKGTYQVRSADVAPRQNPAGLGWWKSTDSQNPLPPPQPPQRIATPEASGSGTYRAPQESSSEEEKDTESDKESDHSEQEQPPSWRASNYSLKKTIVEHQSQLEHKTISQNTSKEGEKQEAHIGTPFLRINHLATSA